LTYIIAFDDTEAFIYVAPLITVSMTTIT